MERLLVDTMLGKLVTYLRMCGYDAAYVPERGIVADDDIVSLARDEGRRVVTRDGAIAAQLPEAVLLEALDIDGQLKELRAAGLPLSLDEPSRCSHCNAALERIFPDEETPAYAPSPQDEPVWRCRECGHHFWQGSHWDDVRNRLASLD